MEIEMTEKFGSPESLDCFAFDDGVIPCDDNNIGGAGASQGNSCADNHGIMDFQHYRGSIQDRNVGWINLDMGISGNPEPDFFHRDREIFLFQKVSNFEQNDNGNDNLDVLTATQRLSSLFAQAWIVGKKPDKSVGINNENHQSRGNGFIRYSASWISSRERSTFPFQMPQRSAKCGTFFVEEGESTSCVKAFFSTLSSASIPASSIDKVSRSIADLKYDILEREGQGRFTEALRVETGDF